MNIFNIHDFGPGDVKAVMDGTATRGTMMAVLTSQTCGEACWHAREEVCRCSCGGRNHGCLKHGGEQPERTSKIGGHLYKLAAVGRYGELIASASAINKAFGYRSVDRPLCVIGSTGGSFTPEQIALARERGERVWWQQYKYTWKETDDGAPARLKTASASQRRWAELQGWQGERTVYLLWQRVTPPEKPSQSVVDSETGEAK